MITAGMTLKNSYALLNLNTPYKASSASGQEDPKQLLDPATERRLHILIVEAEQFLSGVRSQVAMVFDGKKQEAVP